MADCSMVRHEGTPAQRTDAGSGLATISTEESSLLSATSSNNATSTSRCRVARSTGTIVVVLFAGILFLAISFRWRHHETTADPAVAKFPNDFVWGVATSAYQIEGSTLEDGRGLTIWDTFVQSPHAVLDHSTGAVADDHYHRWEEDVALMKRLDIKAYRFSIAWSRILPTGQGTVINEAGVRFYNRLIDVLLLNGIEPWITLFHWDLPQALQDDFGGWLSNSTIDAFYNYSHVVFDRFGKKVKRFITLNEPWTFAVNGHGTGIHAPGRNSHPSIEPYLVAHNLLLAHAKVSKMYKAEFAGTDGMIGMSNCGDYRYPKSGRGKSDRDAAQRAMLFQWGWFVDPLVFGRYPAVMKERLRHRLPDFTEAEQIDLMGSTDFLGLNYYSSLLATTPKHEANHDGYWADMHVDFSGDPRWKQNDMGWTVVPEGLQNMLLWISNRYGNPLVYVTENGSADSDQSDETTLNDEKRLNFFKGHIDACAAAISRGVNLSGYFAWSLMDNFEWQFGFQRRFGICRVDYETLQRTPRTSALWYRDTIRSHGINKTDKWANIRRLPASDGYPSSRALPEKVIIGYGSDCDAVREAIRDGVNIVMWSFLDVTLDGSVTGSDFYGRSGDDVKTYSKRKSHINVPRVVVVSNLNLTAIRCFIEELSDTGFDYVLHFASIGGWNAAHLNEDIPAQAWYQAFNDSVGDVFDGIDWDLEGNDEIHSKQNFFTMACLDKIGDISRLAKAYGRYISIAPPQSYLDIGNIHFSRYVNLTDKVGRDGWHDDFPYFGSNVYAYLLYRYGDFVDLVAIQFYESFSRAGKAVYHDGLSPSDYLIQFVQSLHNSNETMYVDFSGDPELGWVGPQNVSLPLSKLVLGLGNGWTIDVADHKALYVPSDQLRVAWLTLFVVNMLPRGFMFWTIMLEGVNGVYLARDLQRIVQMTEPASEN